MEKDYFVPFADFGEDKFEEKRSKFTGRLWHVETAEQAVAKIKEMRETFWDATHNCYAYILRDGNVMRYSDDGEPQGTAGMPILEVLRHENLTACVCVVTRYFGGILLGMSEQFSKTYISTRWADAIVFGGLVLVLVVKPTGLLGKNINEKV